MAKDWYKCFISTFDCHLLSIPLEKLTSFHTEIVNVKFTMYAKHTERDNPSWISQWFLFRNNYTFNNIYRDKSKSYMENTWINKARKDDESLLKEQLILEIISQEDLIRKNSIYATLKQTLHFFIPGQSHWII